MSTYRSALLGGPCLSPWSWFDKNSAIGSRPIPETFLANSCGGATVSVNDHLLFQFLQKTKSILRAWLLRILSSKKNLWSKSWSWRWNLIYRQGSGTIRWLYWVNWALPQAQDRQIWSRRIARTSGDVIINVPTSCVNCIGLCELVLVALIS